MLIGTIDFYHFVPRAVTLTLSVLQTASKNFSVGMHSDIYKLIWIKLGVMIDTTVLLQSECSLHDLDSRSELQESKSCAVHFP